MPWQWIRSLFLSLEALCPPGMSQRRGQLQVDLLDPLGFLCMLINAAGTLVCYLPCYSSVIVVTRFITSN